MIEMGEVAIREPTSGVSLGEVLKRGCLGNKGWGQVRFLCQSPTETIGVDLKSGAGGDGAFSSAAQNQASLEQVLRRILVEGFGSMEKGAEPRSYGMEVFICK